MNVQNDTIVACSTGTLTNTAIGVIRVSGYDFLERINHLFSVDLLTIRNREATFTKFYDDNLKILDEVIITFFKGPKSYNGEDILEISAHGNQVNIKRIISCLISRESFRPSMPGEFTLRALNNKKLTLNQVEGLDLLLNANNIFALDQGYSLLSGKLQESFNSLYEAYLRHRSSVEFGFDFLEDVGEDVFLLQLRESFNSLKEIIYKLYAQVSNQNFNLIKPEIVLYGLPNAGKSTLFNKLLGESRAIVTEIAGTTRDFIREDLNIEDNIFSIVDTAGVRESLDHIELLGIDKAIKLAEKSFFKILVVNPFEFNKSFYNSISHVDFDLLIVTHRDRRGFGEYYNTFLNEIESFFGPIEPSKSGPIEPSKSGPIEPSKSGPIEPSKSGPIEPSKSGPIEPPKSGPIEPPKSGPIEPLIINLNEDDESFIKSVREKILCKYLKLLSFDPVLIERHSDSIKNIYSEFFNYSQIFEAEDDMAIVSSELNLLGHCISELLGIVSADDVLHNIFKNFCIGK